MQRSELGSWLHCLLLGTLGKAFVLPVRGWTLKCSVILSYREIDLHQFQEELSKPESYLKNVWAASGGREVFDTSRI